MRADQAERLGGSGRSPYPEVEAYMLGLVCDRGGSLRRWAYNSHQQCLAFDVAGYRYCLNIGRQHRSNNIRSASLSLPLLYAFPSLPFPFLSPWTNFHHSPTMSCLNSWIECRRLD